MRVIHRFTGAGCQRKSAGDELAVGGVDGIEDGFGEGVGIEEGGEGFAGGGDGDVGAGWVLYYFYWKLLGERVRDRNE